MKSFGSFVSMALLAGMLAMCLLGGWSISTKNEIVVQENLVDEKMGNLQSAYQRRADLIPNLVRVVEASAQQESAMMTNIARLRSAHTQAMQVSTGATPEELARYAAAQANLSRAINVVMEAYPQMQSVQGYRDLQSQIEGTENRINVARRDYNEAVRVFNTSIMTFPGNVFGSGFARRHPFEAAPGADRAPTVEFHAPAGAQ